jgi:hypothetical protein
MRGDNFRMVTRADHFQPTRPRGETDQNRGCDVRSHVVSDDVEEVD